MTCVNRHAVYQFVSVSPFAKALELIVDIVSPDIALRAKTCVHGKTVCELLSAGAHAKALDLIVDIPTPGITSSTIGVIN